MKQGFKGWNEVAKILRKLADDQSIIINDGQAASLRGIAERLPKNGVIIADEVGMGKTRIAAVVARSVISAGGRVAIVVPPGLGYQWSDELRIAGIADTPPILRSLGQYLQAWETGDNEAPWFKQSAILVSHSFANWRLSDRTSPSRWSLLPEIYARWRKHVTGRFPRDYYGNKILRDEQVKQAAESIVSSISASPKGHVVRKLIQELDDITPWPDALFAAQYGRNALLRPWLERAVGLGLGVFDLIIIDEVHKSRGQDSGLNRLLSNVVLQSTVARCLAMTATPFELEAKDWTQMLERIQVDERSKTAATTAITNYAHAVFRVRQCPSDIDSRESYKVSAENFKKALNPYLLRRDKREDPAVIKFQKISGEHYHDYRHEQEILINTTQLSLEWKQAVCAAEALSFVSRQSDNTTTKRLRLTLGNGHGIAALIDQLQRDDKDDRKQIHADAISEIAVQSEAIVGPSEDKRLLRAEWWQHVMLQPFMKGESVLYDHPAILAAVEEIESVCRNGEKVLVFGRFTRPLSALVQLLNAREMLRCIDGKRPWPQSKVHKNEWTAIVSAHRHLSRPGELRREDLDTILEQQYKDNERQRLNIRENLIAYVEEGLQILQANTRIRGLFEAFKNDVTKVSDQTQGNEGNILVIVARLIQELIGTRLENTSSTEIFAQAFTDLVGAVSDCEDSDANGDGQLDDSEVLDLWTEIRTRLDEEFNGQEGGFARLMFGESKPATRRYLQLAFNRKQGHPKVLVAQSLVGREGLNLHKACRTVVLLHPEWNPGVVEQQIGRIDRIKSLWEVEFDQAIVDKKSNGDLPRIEIRSVVFQGTYDEENWKVLIDRWDDLRAQLHGIVISPRIAKKYSSAEEIISEINKAAPNFSPLSNVVSSENISQTMENNI